MDSKKDRKRKRDRSEDYHREDKKSKKHDHKDEGDIRKQRENRLKYDRQRIERRTRENSQERSPSWGQRKEGGSNSKTSSKNPTEPVKKEKPNFETSGKLAEDTNTFRGVVIKYNEPPEARKPKRRWRLYIFKGTNSLPFLPLHRQSAYLIGRDRRVADIPVDHPSCSKQHAAFQYRLVEYKRPDGSEGKRVCPYIIDLNSANGTYVNNNRIEPQRYVELCEKDVIKFGFSSRDYVLLHDASEPTEEESG